METPANPPKDVLITGASGAIGAAIARRLAAAGYRIHLTSREVSRVAKLQSELTKPGYRPQVYTLDLSDSNQIESTVREFFKASPRPCGLVCNAGDLGALGPFLEVEFDDWKAAVEENFIANASILHAFGNRFIKSKQPEGSVVIVSGAAVGGGVLAKLSSYSTSKAALCYLTETLAIEWESIHLRINAVAPGPVKSRFLENAIKAGAGKVGEYAISAQKCMESGGVSPDLAAQVIEFLMGPECHGMTGRLLSARFDQNRLREEPETISKDADLFRLRRIDRVLYGRS